MPSFMNSWPLTDCPDTKIIPEINKNRKQKAVKRLICIEINAPLVFFDWLLKKLHIFILLP
ncbi:hypothetical protein ES705_43877 [subsurface metagenome]